MMSRSINLLRLLTAKSIKVMARKKSLRSLFFVSSALVFGMLYFMWYLSRHQQLRFMTSDAYEKLQFRMYCSANRLVDSQELLCKPDDQSEDRSARGMTPSEALFSKMSSGVLDADNKDASRFAALLSSVMMNGLPLLGLDDYVVLSDFVGQQIGQSTKATLLSSPGYKEKFHNFLEVRSNRIFLYPDSCWTRQLVEYMRNETVTFRSLTVKVFRTKKQALHHCCHNVWAIIEVQAGDEEVLDSDCQLFEPEVQSNTTLLQQALSGVVPEITIRMHPAAVPDTRNFEYSPINRHLLTRQESGQLLYFTSGFLTLQIEIQNFLAHYQLGGPEIHSKVFSGENGDILLRPALAAHSLAVSLAAARTEEDVYQAVRNASRSNAGVRPSLAFPLFHRAFPTHNNKQSLFWHTFGALTSIGLILFFSLPAAITAGEYSRERAIGLLDVLSTLPGVRRVHSLAGWCMAGALWAGLCALLAWAFFAAVLKHTSPLLPAVTLLLLGLTLCPMSALIGMIMKSADAVVVAVPTAVFVTLLPGLLYFELAFDVQRSVFGELALCLLPASAAALILRTVCGYEAINAGVDWLTQAPISDCPMYAYVLMLALDVGLYTALALYCATREDRKAATQVEEPEAYSSHRAGSLLGFLRRWCGLASERSRSGEGGVADDIELVGASANIRPVTAAAADDQFALQVRGVSKSYSAHASDTIEVLSDINANLWKQSITLLLGSNGAGKTTLMKILSGLDPAYQGSVCFPGEAHVSSDCSQQKRQIGWCPQNDALYEQLTVREHLLLLSSMIGDLPCPEFTRPEWWEAWTSWMGLQPVPAVPTETERRRDMDITAMLTRLDLLQHGDKPVFALSGGMKRRLSLCLAFLGEPPVLFLDEPTSGCDAYTRELVRKDILARKGASAVLISTHHTDDVDVLADRVWFLSERFLEVDEAVENLAAWRDNELLRRSPLTVPSSASPGVSECVSSYGSQVMEFSTLDAQVKRIFEEHFGSHVAAGWVDSSESSSAGPQCSQQGSQRGVTTWAVPVGSLSALRGLVARLEGSDLRSWSLSTCRTYNALCHLYDQHRLPHSSPQRRPSPQRQSRQATAPARAGAAPLLTLQRHLRAVLWLRFLELRHSLGSFLLAQVLLPFLVVFAVAWGCRDVLYPKTEITSRSIDGVGEMCFADGGGGDSAANPIARSDLTGVATAIGNRALAVEEAEVGDALFASAHSNASSAFSAAVTEQLGRAQVSWQGTMGSDEMWRILFASYYAHPQRRWAAFVAEDFIPQWISSTVVLGQDAFRMDVSAVYDAILRAQQELCNSSTVQHLVAQADPRADGNASAVSQVCGDVPALRFELENSSYGDGKYRYSNLSLSVSSYESLRANLTMLSNVTTDHAAPLYLKEVVPKVYTALLRSNADPGFNATAAVLGPNYRLYSHPLPLSNRSNDVYLARGYLGSTVVVLYTLMTTITCVRSVIRQRKEGTTAQLHLAGLLPVTYWTANLAVDALLCCASFAGIFGGIMVGGPPISDYFFEFPPYPGVLFALCLVSFALSAAASSHTLAVLSVDALACQMQLLISAVVTGLFLKMFLDRHLNEVSYMAVSRVLLHASPAYAFSTTVFDLIAMHALQVSAAAQGKPGPDQAHRLRSVYHCVVLMLVQAAWYVVLTCAIDAYRVRVRAAMGKWWWWRATNPAAEDAVSTLPATAASQEEEGLLAATGRQNSYGSLVRTEEGTAESRVDVTAVRESLVCASGVAVRYPGQERLALRSATFHIAPGEKVALLGMNGGGKSTLFRALALSDNPLVNGTLTVRGVDVVADHWQLGARNLIGYVPQDGGLFDFLTVDETLALFSLLRSPGDGDAGAGGLCRDDIIPEQYLRYPVYALSGGTRKKLLVRVANVAHPALLLLDECTTGVGPIAAEGIVRYLKHSVDSGTRQGMLFASHRIDESVSVCDRVLVLAQGRVLLDGPISLLHELAHRYYQVDIRLLHNEIPASPDARHIGDAEQGLDWLLSGLSDGQDGRKGIERVVVYSPCMVRVALEKAAVPIAQVWGRLVQWVQAGKIRTYSFRSMEMEEVLSGVISP